MGGRQTRPEAVRVTLSSGGGLQGRMERPTERRRGARRERDGPWQARANGQEPKSTSDLGHSRSWTVSARMASAERDRGSQ